MELALPCAEEEIIAHQFVWKMMSALWQQGALLLSPPAPILQVVQKLGRKKAARFVESVKFNDREYRIHVTANNNACLQ